MANWISRDHASIAATLAAQRVALLEVNYNALVA